MTATRGKHIGRQFWRCPYWMMKDTCNMFIWADEVEEIDDTDEIEDVDDVGCKDVSVIALGIAEESRKKNVKLYKRFNQERMKGKVSLTLLIVSLIINLVLVMKLMF
ncbi:uncharacterized protein [Medicago truncatula]|uniref:uncharacterized protein n=1 Tax=Medicago truncatula TaxID=3880 RepID=UPI000D2F464E|nr:uncharacterized protein LOC11409670 [Medicago truncatula]